MTEPKKNEPNKTELIKLRVTPEQKSAVIEKAIKSGDTLSDYVKSKIGLEKTGKKRKMVSNPIKSASTRARGASGWVTLDGRSYVYFYYIP